MRLFAIIGLTWLLAGCRQEPPTSPLDSPAGDEALALDQAELQELARRAWWYAQPMVRHLQAIEQISGHPELPGFRAEPNVLLSDGSLPYAGDTTTAFPTQEVLHTTGVLDLRQEPQVLSVPESLGRYYGFQLMDLWGESFDFLGSLDNGGTATDYLLVGPDWGGTPPPGVELVRSPSTIVTLVGRTEVAGYGDLKDARWFLQQVRLTPMHQYVEGPPPRTPERSLPSVDPTSLQEGNVLQLLYRVWQEQPPSEEEEKAFVASLAPLGVSPTQPWPPSNLAEDVQDAIRAGFDDAEQELARQVQARTGWFAPIGVSDPVGPFGSEEELMRRALKARHSLWAPEPYQIRVLQTRVDEHDEPLDGSLGPYTLTLSAAEVPPEDTLWSITVHRLPEGDFVNTKLGRYQLTNHSPLRRNEDGSLTIYLQQWKPPGFFTNWLPTPNGPFQVTLRLYDPTTDQEMWQPPGIRNPRIEPRSEEDGESTKPPSGWIKPRSREDEQADKGPAGKLDDPPTPAGGSPEGTGPGLRSDM